MERTSDMSVSRCPRCGSERTWLVDTEVLETGEWTRIFEYMHCDGCEREYTNAYQLIYQYADDDED